jgi:hypothetical protein
MPAGHHWRDAKGKEELVGLIDGVRGTARPFADGALGFRQAVEEVWPKARGQRCWCTRLPMSSTNCRRVNTENQAGAAAAAIIIINGTVEILNLARLPRLRRMPGAFQSGSASQSGM